MGRGPLVRRAHLPDGVMGLWDERARTVWLDDRLTGVEARCTLVHELVHAERGDVPCDDPVLDARQERRVEHESARRLVPWPALLEVSRWAAGITEAAEALDVDRATLEARLDGLTATERRRLDAVGLG